MIMSHRESNNMRIKRLMDIIGVVPLIPFLPVVLLVSWVVGKIGGYGSLLFFQDRIGFRGKRIRVVKVRTLKEENGKLVAGPVFRIIRKIGLDEVPQLIHVLKGEMSCVGPRPLLPEEMNPGDSRLDGRLQALLEARQSVKPGLTGITQLLGGNRGRKERSDLVLLSDDLWYVKNKSLGLDVRILIYTALHAVSLGRIRFPRHRVTPSLESILQPKPVEAAAREQVSAAGIEDWTTDEAECPTESRSPA
jgi:sugar transferase EpsL